MCGGAQKGIKRPTKKAQEPQSLRSFSNKANEVAAAQSADLSPKVAAATQSVPIGVLEESKKDPISADVQAKLGKKIERAHMQENSQKEEEIVPKDEPEKPAKVVDDKVYRIF